MVLLFQSVPYMCKLSLEATLQWIDSLFVIINKCHPRDYPAYIAMLGVP